MQISNETGYMSSLFFIQTLTELCDKVLKSEEKEKTLIEGLQAINQELPAKVYIPFLTESCRNYNILHIRVSEAKVFCTKTRAPYLCVLEMYRPEEIKFKNVDRDNN